MYNKQCLIGYYNSLANTSIVAMITNEHFKPCWILQWADRNYWYSQRFCGRLVENDFSKTK